jgi:hypothetical protein
MNFTSFRTLKTKCGKEFDKDLLKVIAFTTHNLKYTHSTYTIYKSPFNDYIRCSNNYDAITDYSTIVCEFITEAEALTYVNKKSS